MPLARQACSHGLDDFLSRGENAERRQGPCVDDALPVHQHLELTIMALDHLHLGSQLAAEPRRHTDGVEPGDSIGAVTNGDATHADLLLV